MKIDGFNPGWSPCGHRVLVKPIAVEDVSQGGIILANSIVEKDQMAQIDAVVVAVGPEAWHDRPGKGRFPWANPGDTVMIARYAGLLRKGADGEDYRVISDLDVVAIKHEEVEQ